VKHRRWVHATLLVSAVCLVACGKPGERELPVASAEWAGETQVWVYVDCAELLDVNVDRSGDRVKLTLTGKPDDGDCTDDWMVLKVEPGTRSFIDASTGKSIKLPPYVPSPNPGHG
jgi:hypothetical protein